MERQKLTWFLLTVMSILPFSESFHNYTSEENELVYDYIATISAGTNVSDYYVSQSFLGGKLHVQRAENSLFVRLSTLTMKLYNGLANADYEDALDELPIPIEYEDLLRIFRIDYDSQGHVTAISTEKRELTPARNIKKAIASVLQLDIRAKNASDNFQTEELSIFGNANVSYTLTQVTNQSVVEKEIVIPTETIKNAQSYCEEFKGGSLLQNNKYKYVVNAEGFVESVEVTELVTLHSVNSKFLHVEQKLQLDGVESIVERFQLHQEFTEESLTYTMDEHVSFGGAKEYYYLGFEATTTSIYNELQTLLIEMGQNGLGTSQETFKYGVSVAKILRLMRNFSIDGLEKLYIRLKDWSSDNSKLLDVVHQLLPYSGSQASTALIKQLVVTKSVAEETAMDMLRRLPFHIMAHTEPDLENLGPLLNLGLEFSENLRKSAILCFSNVIGRMDSSSLKYVDLLIDRLFNSRDYDSQLLYLTALLNTGKADVYNRHLVSIIKGGGLANKIRLATIWTVASVSSNNSEIFEALWLTFSNASEPFEIRGASYFVLIESNPSFANILGIHNQMKNETDSELYHVHYRHIETLSQSTLNDTAAKILHLAPEPTVQGPSNYYATEFPGGITLSIVTLNSFTFAFFKFHSQIINASPYFLTIYARELSFSAQTQRNFSLGVTDVQKATFDLIYGQYNQIVHISSYNFSNLKEIRSLLTLPEPKGLLTNYNGYGQKYLGTNLGIPIAAEILEPIFYQYEDNVEISRKKNGYNIALMGHYHIFKNLQYGIQFFNPIADVWQGVKNYNIYHDEVSLELSGNVIQVGKGANVSLQVRTSLADSTHRSLSAVFVNEGVFYSEILSKACEGCKNWLVIDQ